MLWLGSESPAVTIVPSDNDVCRFLAFSTGILKMKLKVCDDPCIAWASPPRQEETEISSKSTGPYKSGLAVYFHTLLIKENITTFWVCFHPQAYGMNVSKVSTIQKNDFLFLAHRKKDKSVF